jgi:hypothetical protein
VYTLYQQRACQQKPKNTNYPQNVIAPPFKHNCRAILSPKKYRSSPYVSLVHPSSPHDNTHKQKEKITTSTTHNTHQKQKSTMIPLPTSPNRPPKLRSLSSKHVKVILNKEPPHPQYIEILSQAARNEGSFKSELSSILLHKLEHPHARMKSPHHFPIPADLGFDIDDYVEFTAPARKQKNSVITRHFVGENASVVITFTAKNDPTLFPAPYAFQTSMMTANLINRCDLDILRRNLKTGNERMIPTHNISPPAHRQIMDFLNKQEEWAAHTAAFLAIESVASYCRNSNATTRNRANKIPLSPIKKDFIVCTKCKRRLEEYHSKFPLNSFTKCQWAVTSSSFMQSPELETPNGQLLFCPKCASEHSPHTCPRQCPMYLGTL